MKLELCTYQKKAFQQLPSLLFTSPSSDQNQDYPATHFLPNITEVTKTMLHFLGEYTQSRHLLLLEVYDKKTAYINRTWSATFEGAFYSDEEREKVIKQYKGMRLAKSRLERETDLMAQLCNGKSYENGALVLSEDDLKSYVEQHVIQRINQQLRDLSVGDAGEETLTDVSLGDLKLRALYPILHSNEAFFETQNVEVDWYVAFIDPVDEHVESGQLHRWGKMDNPAIQDELKNVVKAVGHELKYYFRSYKDQCEQYIWSKEQALVGGYGFDEGEQNWLVWLQEFIRDRVVCERVEYLLPNTYFKSLKYSDSRVKVRPYSDFVEQVQQKLSKKLTENETDWWNILHLFNLETTSILVVPICEYSRHDKSEPIEVDAYSTRWSLVISKNNEHFSYLHALFLRTIARQVAKVRHQSVKNQLLPYIRPLFKDETSLVTHFNQMPEQAHSNIKFDEPNENVSLASKVITVVQQAIIGPFLGLQMPMLLATQNSAGHIFHLATNKAMDQQFALKDDNQFEDGKATLNLLLKLLGDEKAKEFKPGELVMARPKRLIETGRYAYAVKLELLSGRIFDGVILFLGRHNIPFDIWSKNCLDEVARAIAPLLSVSAINQQALTQMGLFQHAVNSPVHGIISDSKMVIRASKKFLQKSDSVDPAEKETLEKALNAYSKSIEEGAGEVRSWKVAIQALEGKANVDLSQRHNLVQDIERWTQRYKRRAEEQNLSLEMFSRHNSVLITYDPIFLDIAFSNILDNAIKYSTTHQQGKGVVRVKLVVHTPYVEVQVSNYGPFLSYESIERLLGFGQRGKDAVESFVGGQGIGLPLVTAFIQRHANGELRIQSTPIADDCSVALNTFILRFMDHEKTNLDIG